MLETRNDQMKLDLSFFKPPATESSEFNNPLKNITFEKHQLKNGSFYREQDSGICDLYNALSTNCITDKNTTNDINNNLITYDEVTFSNFTTDENNNYIKTKIIHLKDITDKIKYLNKGEHKNLLDIMFEKLKHI